MYRDQRWFDRVTKALLEGQEKRRKLEPPWRGDISRDVIDTGCSAIHLQDEVNRLLAQVIALAMSVEARFPSVKVREDDGSDHTDAVIGSYSELIRRDEVFQRSVRDMAKELSDKAMEHQAEADKVAERFWQLCSLDRAFSDV